MIRHRMEDMRVTLLTGADQGKLTRLYKSSNKTDTDIFCRITIPPLLF